MARFLRSYLASCTKVHRLSRGTALSQEFPTYGQVRDFELRDELSRRFWPGFERTHGTVLHVLPNGCSARRATAEWKGDSRSQPIGVTRVGLANDEGGYPARNRENESFWPVPH